MKSLHQRSRVRTTLGVGTPLIVIWLTGAYSLYRATSLEPDAALRAWIVGLLLMGCSTLVGLQLHRPLALEGRLSDLEHRADSEKWGCSTEEGVHAVVTALRDATPRERPHVLRQDDATT
jgi:hypothetical protein